MRRTQWILIALAGTLSGGAAATTDPEAELLELHREVLAAHMERDVERLMADEAPDSVVANRGEISFPSEEQRREMFGGYFGSTEFSVYRDLVDPVVKVSADGTLGWVIAQVEVRGTQATASGEQTELEFVSAWIELYERRDGDWVRIGNVSNFRPPAR